MRIVHIYAHLDKSVFYLNTCLGILLTKKEKKEKNVFLVKSNRVIETYKKVINPYTLSVNNAFIGEQNYNKWVKTYAKTLVYLSGKSFFLTKFFVSILPAPTFNDTKEAIAVFRSIYPGEEQEILCLPRTFFAIATSKSFKMNGVAFIGAFLPSRRLHAWIIEDDVNPDIYDNAWICYQPVAAIYFKK